MGFILYVFKIGIFEKLSWYFPCTYLLLLLKYVIDSGGENKLFRLFSNTLFSPFNKFYFNKLQFCGKYETQHLAWRDFYFKLNLFYFLLNVVIVAAIA